MSHLSRRKMLNASLQGILAAEIAGHTLTQAEPSSTSTLPAVPGELQVVLRHRVKATNDEQEQLIEEFVAWKASETAIIICDMWAEHPCKMAAQRVGRIAPKMNQVVSDARDHGVAIIHAPSGGMHHYDGTPYRQRMQKAAFTSPPVPIQDWCYLDEEREAPMPVEVRKRATDAVHGCDDPEPRAHKNHDRHEHSAIKIIGYDGISDNGQEVYNFLEQENRKNIVLMGVHTNMCVLGRSFAIRQMTYLGKNVALCRDLTDALYDPRDKPYVSHTRGTQLIVEHIERFWCPSLLSQSLTTIGEGTNDPRG